MKENMTYRSYDAFAYFRSLLPKGGQAVIIQIPYTAQSRRLFRWLNERDVNTSESKAKDRFRTCVNGSQRVEEMGDLVRVKDP